MKEFIKVGKLSEIPIGQKKLVKIGQEEVLIINLRGKIYALSNKCSHLNFLLSEGKIQGDYILCPGHGGKFDIATGRVVSPPPKVSIPAYEVKVKDDDISVRLTQKTGDLP